MSLFAPLQMQIAISTYPLRHRSVYFLHKTKIANSRLVNFCHALFNCSSFILKSIPPGHYGRCSGYLGSLVAIQQWVHEEIALTTVLNSCVFVFVHNKLLNYSTKHLQTFTDYIDPTQECPLVVKVARLPVIHVIVYLEES